MQLDKIEFSPMFAHLEIHDINENLWRNVG